MTISTRFRRAQPSDERGVTMVLVAIAMVAIIAMAAMSIDLVTLYLAREEAQRASDAGALAAARVISASGIMGTAAPLNNIPAWSVICGPIAVGSTNGWATQAATSVAAQNTVNGHPVNVIVTYSDGKQSGGDCSLMSAAFAVNPMVTVQVRQVSIPSFFSRIWGSTASLVSASATAEVFNPSNSGAEGVAPNGSVTPVQPRCVKPLIVPNIDPGNGTCTSTSTPPCPRFVNPIDGSLGHPGISLAGDGVNGVIGEQFTMYIDCTAGTDCTGLIDNGPTANSSRLPPPPPPSPATLEYLPGAVGAASVAVPSCTPTSNFYQSAVAGCDRNTIYQCGVVVTAGGNPNQIDLNENPGGATGDTAMGLSCTLTGRAGLPLDGQDTLRAGYPLLPFAGDRNPAVPINTPVINSNSVMSLPIYDSSVPLAIGPTNQAPVTIVGFLQVFVRDVDPNGNPQVTVLNVAGCGDAATNPPVFGNSPLPVRLITPPPPQ